MKPIHKAWEEHKKRIPYLDKVQNKTRWHFEDGYCRGYKDAEEKFKERKSINDHRFEQIKDVVSGMGGWANFAHYVNKRRLGVASVFDTILIDAKEAINTTWRFIGAYKKENHVPIEGALKSAEYHLKEADYLFDDKEIEKRIKDASNDNTTDTI